MNAKSTSSPDMGTNNLIDVNPELFQYEMTQVYLMMREDLSPDHMAQKMAQAVPTLLSVNVNAGWETPGKPKLPAPRAVPLASVSVKPFQSGNSLNLQESPFISIPQTSKTDWIPVQLPKRKKVLSVSILSLDIAKIWGELEGPQAFIADGYR